MERLKYFGKVVMSVLVTAMVICFCRNVRAENRIEGASFECGFDGMEIVNTVITKQEFPLNDFEKPSIEIGGVHGNQCLEIAKGNQAELGITYAYSGLATKRYKLEAGVMYTLSVYMKASEACSVGLYVGEDIWWPLHSWSDVKTEQVTTEWQRYEKVFMIDAFLETDECFVWIGFDMSDTQAVTLWMDAMQLETGYYATDFESQNLDFFASVERDNKLFELEESIPLKLNFRNNTTALEACCGQYQVKNFWGGIEKSGVFAVEIEENESVEKIIDIQGLPYGHFKAIVDIGGETEEVIFGVYKERDPEGLVPENSTVGTHNRPSIEMKKLGFGLMRTWKFGFYDMSKFLNESPDKDFTIADRVFDLIQAHDTRVMAVLGSVGDETVPVYARGLIKPNGIALPTVGYWQEYVTIVVDRYKDAIDYWAIYNEIGYYFTAAEYLPYLQAAYTIIKALDPTALVVGVCGSFEGADADPQGFVDQIIEIGGLDCMDIMSFHLYNSTFPEDYRGIGIVEYIEGFKVKMIAKGKEIPVWNGEQMYHVRQSGYSQDILPFPTSLIRDIHDIRGVDTAEEYAEYTIRSHVLIDTMGGKQFMLGDYDAGQFTSKATIIYPAYSSHVEYDNSPRPSKVALNAMINVLDGFEYWEEADWGDGKRCYLYKNDEMITAVIWAYDGDVSHELVLPDISYRVLDFFGNVTKETSIDGGFTVELTGDVKYLQMYINTAEMILEKVQGE